MALQRPFASHPRLCEVLRMVQRCIEGEFDVFKSSVVRSLAIFTTISAVLSEIDEFAAARRRLIQRFRHCNRDRSRHLPCNHCAVVRLRCGLRSRRSSGEAAIRLADVTSKPSSTARLAAAVSSTSERRAGRISLAGRLIRVLPMISRPLDELSQNPAPQPTNFLRSFSLLRKLGHA